MASDNPSYLRPVLVASLVMTGCGQPLDPFGVQERVVETKVERTDDRLSDKHPEYDPELVVRETFDGCEFVLNKSASVTRLTLQDLGDEDGSLSGVLFPTRAAALAALGERPVIASMEAVQGMLKPFNDGLYAAVELAVEQGADGALVNKRAVLDGVLAELVARYQASPDGSGLREAAADFAAAASLGGASALQIPADLASAAASVVNEFEADPFYAQPIGFYTWLPELEAVFRRDRLLMVRDPGPVPAAQVAGILGQNTALEAGYSALLDLYAGLTNPAMAYSPLDILTAASDGTAGADPAAWATAFVEAHADYGQTCGKSLSWLPPSTSPETELFDEMACSGSLGGNLLDALIEAIQTGAVDLAPTADSGWYDRQLYALETLLLPDRARENEHLLLTQQYKEKLVETFKSLLIQTRETHAKQLGMSSRKSAGDPQPVNLYPLLPVEPFPTFYLRTARAYSFLQTFLGAAIGSEALATIARLREDGTRAAEPLSTELEDKTRLLYGLHLVAAASIGMRHEISEQERALVDLGAAEADARLWLESWGDDEDVLRDPRVILPVARDELFTTYWAVAGVKVLRMHASYPEGYEPEVVESGWCSVEEFVPFEPYLLVEQTLEVERPSDAAPLGRDEFRRMADDHSTLEQLREALEAAE